MLIIYTGNGKGKTTAALGLALRAAGWGRKVCILQFVKEESWPEGARIALRKTKGKLHIDIRALGTGFVGIMGDKKPISVHKKAAEKAVSAVLKALRSLKYDLIICDEILGALYSGLISRKDVEQILKAKPVDTDLVFTGRNAPEWLIKKADLVTEMREIKHPFTKGIQAKKGVDY